MTEDIIKSMQAAIDHKNACLDGYAAQHEAINETCAAIVGRELPIEDRVKAVCAVVTEAVEIIRPFVKSDCEKSARAAAFVAKYGKE